MLLRLSKSIFPLEKQMTAVRAQNKNKPWPRGYSEMGVGVGGGRVPGPEPRSETTVLHSEHRAFPNAPPFVD